MELRIPDPALADLCCSRAALEARWGQDWCKVARRLCELRASADLDAVAALPGVQVRPITLSEIEVSFREGVIVRLRGDVASRDRTSIPGYRVAVAELTAVTVDLTEDVRR